MKGLRRRLAMAWYLWRQVKFDGLGNRIRWWEVWQWAGDEVYWGIKREKGENNEATES